MSATRDEVLRAMGRAVRERGIDPAKAEAQVLAALAAAEQAGWRLVPVEADEAMWDAGRYQIVAGEGALDIWTAMLDAAPKVTQ